MPSAAFFKAHEVPPIGKACGKASGRAAASLTLAGEAGLLAKHIEVESQAVPGNDCVGLTGKGVQSITSRAASSRLIRGAGPPDRPRPNQIRGSSRSSATAAAHADSKRPVLKKIFSTGGQNLGRFDIEREIPFRRSLASRRRQWRTCGPNAAVSSSRRSVKREHRERTDRPAQHARWNKQPHCPKPRPVATLAQQPTLDRK